VSFEQSKRYGDMGEAVVAQILDAHCGADGRIVNDVLLDGVDTTTQIDHMLIDRFGILIVETKRYRALIRGTSDDRHWTACYKGGKRQTFHNPLRQNEGHRSKLARVLQQNGLRLSPDYTQSVIVFACGGLDALDLAPEDRARVMSADEFAKHLETRADFAPNDGDLDPGTVSSVAYLLESLDKTADADVLGRHVQMVQSAKRGGSRVRRSRPATRAKTSPRPAPFAARVDRPQVQWSAQSTQRPRSGVLALLAVGLLFSLALIGSGLLSLLGAAATGLGPPSGSLAAPSVAAQPSLTYDVASALARLKETDSDVYDALANPQSPALSETGGYATYTWDYARKASSDRVETGTFSLSLDSAGRIVGVNSQ